jgi:hypothetical protein
MKRRSLIDGLHFDTPAMRATDETTSHSTKPASWQVAGYQCERPSIFRSSRVGAQRRIEGGWK